jgi:hypothetical protein
MYLYIMGIRKSNGDKGTQQGNPSSIFVVQWMQEED